MKTILSLAVGFYLGRKLYIQYNEQEALAKEKEIKRKLTALLEDSDFSKLEVKEHVDEVLGIG